MNNRENWREILELSNRDHKTTGILSIRIWRLLEALNGAATEIERLQARNELLETENKLLREESARRYLKLATLRDMLLKAD